MRNTGIHHISSLVSDIEVAYDFYHRILGLKLLLKTVNQEDSRMYHLFFGDEEGQEGSEFTIFEMKDYRPNRFGTNALERTLFLVNSYDSLLYWEERLTGFAVQTEGVVPYQDGHILRFEDSDGQKLGLLYQKHGSDLKPYLPSDMPSQHAILGLAQIHVRVRELVPVLDLLRDVFDFRAGEAFRDQGLMVYPLIFDNAFGHQIHLIEDRTSPISVIGVGGIHHLALGVASKDDLEGLATYLDSQNLRHTGLVDRDFMTSLYFRAPNYLMFEVATALYRERTHFPAQGLPFRDLPLFLPEFLEKERTAIEAGLA